MHENTSLDKIELNGQDYLYWRKGSGDTVEIYDIAVNSDRQRGTGRALIEQLKIGVFLLLPDTKLIFAITRESNLIAHIFYGKIGFELIAKLPGFYVEEDARMYGLKL